MAVLFGLGLVSVSVVARSCAAALPQPAEPLERNSETNRVNQFHNCTQHFNQFHSVNLFIHSIFNFNSFKIVIIITANATTFSYHLDNVASQLLVLRPPHWWPRSGQQPLVHFLSVPVPFPIPSPSANVDVSINLGYVRLDNLKHCKFTRFS